MKELKVFVPEEVDLVSKAWLDTGFKLWEESLVKTRDFFLPRLNPSLDDFNLKLATSSDLAGMGTRLLAELRLPEKGPEGWELAGETLFGPNLVAAFSVTPGPTGS